MSGVNGPKFLHYPDLPFEGQIREALSPLRPNADEVFGRHVAKIKFLIFHQFCGLKRLAKFSQDCLEANK